MINKYKLFKRFSWNLALSFVFIEDAFKLRKIIPYYLSINFMMKGGTTMPLYQSIKRENDNGKQILIAQKKWPLFWNLAMIILFLEMSEIYFGNSYMYCIFRTPYN